MAVYLQHVTASVSLLRLLVTGTGIKKRKTLWVVRIFDGTEACLDLFHFLSGLHWWEV